MSRQQSLFLLHFIVFLWGFTGILGKILTDVMSPQLLVWYRMLIGFLALGAYTIYKGLWARIDGKRVLQLLAIGGIIAAHWISFFAAIQASNVSIALVCLSTGSLFTALIEPLVFKRKVQIYEFLLGFVVLLALAFIFKFETQYQKGIILSVISAFLASLFTVFNGRQVKQVHPVQISLIELGSGCLLVTVFLLGRGETISIMPSLGALQWISLLALGTICTAFAFVASVQVMKVLSPFTVSLSINLEPIYSIILAFIFFQEHRFLSLSFFIGALVILTTVIFNAYLKARQREKEALTQ